MIRLSVGPRRKRRSNKTISRRKFGVALGALGLVQPKRGRKIVELRVARRRRRKPVRMKIGTLGRIRKVGGLAAAARRRGRRTLMPAGLLGPRGTRRRARIEKRKPNRRHRRVRRQRNYRRLYAVRRHNRKRRVNRRRNYRRLYSVRRRNTRRGRGGRFVARRYNRRHNYRRPLRSYRLHNRKHRSRNRRRNKGVGGGLVGQIKRWALPVLGGVVGVAAGRYLGNWVAEKVGQYPAPVGVATDVALMAATQMLLPKVKAIPESVRMGVMIGLGIDAVARIVGALMPADNPLAQLLLGTVKPAGMLPVSTGTGQYDVYEAGLLGGVGSYVTEPGGMQGVGSYVQEQLGASVYEAPAGFGADVYEAPAGIGSYVTEGNGPFDGGSGIFDDDFGLDAAEAAIEGLGAVQNQVEAAGGKLAYASDQGKRDLQQSGARVMPVAKSKRLPGVDIVAVQPSQPIDLNPGYVTSQATGRAFQAIPTPQGSTMPRVAGGVFEPLYDV